jgi:hypothetical protein
MHADAQASPCEPWWPLVAIYIVGVFVLAGPLWVAWPAGWLLTFFYGGSWAAMTCPCSSGFEARQLGDDVLHDAVGDILLLRIAAQIGNREDGDRGLISTGSIESRPIEG